MKTKIVLTDSARRHAERSGAAERLAALELGAWAQVGDRLGLGADAAQDYAVLRRRILAGADGLTLEITLDHPARG